MPAKTRTAEDLNERLSSAALAIAPDQTTWTEPQEEALRAIGLTGAPPAVLLAFLHQCQATQLDPFRREIHLVSRNTTKGVVWTPQTGIDGYRAIAESTGTYAGRVGPEWCGDDGKWLGVWVKKDPPAACRVGVIRRGFDGPLWATVVFEEFAPYHDVYVGEGRNRRKTGEKVLGPMWAKMPTLMIAKCAEAAALRAAFPRNFAGLYIDEEMHAADAEAERFAAERARAARAAAAHGATGPVIDGETVAPEEEPLDRPTLLAELAWQAAVLGKTVAQHTTRWAAAHGKNIDDATDEELEAFLASRREQVEHALSGLPEDSPLRAGPTPPDADTPGDDAAEATDGADAPPTTGPGVFGWSPDCVENEETPGWCDTHAAACTPDGLPGEAPDLFGGPE